MVDIRMVWFFVFFTKGNIANKCILADRGSKDKRQQFLNETAFPLLIWWRDRTNHPVIL